MTETPEILFARLDVKEVLAKVEEHKAAQAAEAAQKENVIDIEAKEAVSYDDFAKLQFQVGENLSCEAVSES